MNNPTKIAKYSGTKVPYIGMFVLYLPDGTGWDSNNPK